MDARNTCLPEEWRARRWLRGIARVTLSVIFTGAPAIEAPVLYVILITSDTLAHNTDG